MHTKVRGVLDMILAEFKQGTIAETVALATYPPCDIPSARWSLLNRLIMYVVGKTEDARGYRQWQAASRQVKKGSRSFHILAPCVKKLEVDDGAGGGATEKLIITGFRPQPVFRVEDTEGQELAYAELRLPEKLPLLEVAAKWGIQVKAVPGGGGFYGSYSPGGKAIRLASPSELVFYHELAHAAHDRIRPLRGGQRWDQEIVAELSATALSRLVGSRIITDGHSYRYIEDYAAKAKKDVLTACAEVIADVERVLHLILEARGEMAEMAA